MRDMFDDFLDELRRRQAEQSHKSGEPGAEAESDPGTDAQAGDRSSTEGPVEDTPVSSNGTDSDNGAGRSIRGYTDRPSCSGVHPRPQPNIPTHDGGDGRLANRERPRTLTT